MPCAKASPSTFRTRHSRGSVMTLAAGKMGVSLRQLYKQISDWLRSQGVEAAGLPVTTVGGVGGPSKAVETTMSRTLLTLDKLRRLLSGELDPTPMVGGVKDFIHTVPASFDALQDMKMVEPMMKRLAARATLSEAAPGSPLLAASSAGHSAGADPEQEPGAPAW